MRESDLGTRTAIVSAAADLFRRQGYASTSMQQVAERAGISKGNLTYHFPSKQVLYAAVHDQMARYLQERLLQRAFSEAADVVSGLELFTGRLRWWMIDEDGHFLGCPFTNLSIETQRTDPAIALLGRQLLGDLKRLLAAYLKEGQERGEVRRDQNADELVAAFFWMYAGALALSRAMNDPAEYDAFRQRLRAHFAPEAAPSGVPSTARSEAWEVER